MLAGVAATALGAGLGELAAALLAPSSGPVSVIGSALIDVAPPWAKDTAIALFGTADKVALVTGIAIALLAVAAGAGVLEARRAPWGRGVLLALGGAGVLAAVTRADAGPLAAVPSIIAGGVAAIVLTQLAMRLRPGVDGAERAAAAEDRRRFLAWTAVSIAVGALAAAGSQVARTTARTVDAVRSAVRLPRPTATASVPAGADLGLDGLAPLITPNGAFYRIDTAIIVPQVDPADWSLRIHGMVEEEVVLSWEDVLALPLAESTTTLACVSNEVGGDLIGNAVWLGYPIRELLARARPTADADMVLSRSIDGFTASTPLQALTDERDAILAVGMNGEPLPVEHGFPARLVVPGLYGYVSATKWVTELEVTRFDRARAYWTDRGWSERGPIKLQSRIDVPRRSAPAGQAVIAGVAWQQHVGVAGVEVQIDDGPWRPATLAPAISDDTWVQWSLPWTADAGSHRLRCRATSRTGEVQTDQEAPPAPDGATGWHTVDVTVS
ncbi:DMSO/TMAO reductase YedYZ molybdopterin-dependent catalytic subunit [Microbacterium telephonicum]|uniref:DMSO/TMAO reductase YedYZ molybdopterin-dependent catalytic subunit n=2 Tax=Microbacterium telephonicum TaxID=1714841 RepID=A0A498CJP2_9MICO|nr:DMSO/TMAO reductase YedYZ molybdopterin-dependent catalytic subunit [Microbacterium telephonicum]